MKILLALMSLLPDFSNILQKETVSTETKQMCSHSLFALTGIYAGWKVVFSYVIMEGKIVGFLNFNNKRCKNATRRHQIISLCLLLIIYYTMNLCDQIVMIIISFFCKIRPVLNVQFNVLKYILDTNTCISICFPCFRES